MLITPCFKVEGIDVDDTIEELETEKLFGDGGLAECLGKDITDEVVITGEEAFCGDSVVTTTDEAIFLNFL